VIRFGCNYGIWNWENQYTLIEQSQTLIQQSVSQLLQHSPTIKLRKHQLCENTMIQYSPNTMLHSHARVDLSHCRVKGHGTHFAHDYCWSTCKDGYLQAKWVTCSYLGNYSIMSKLTHVYKCDVVLGLYRIFHGTLYCKIPALCTWQTMEYRAQFLLWACRVLYFAIS